MAGSDEALRLSAEIVNKWSGPLKEMQRSLRSLSAETAASHKLGTVQAKSHTESLLALKREVTAVGDRVRGVFTPALVAMGVGSLSAATGIAKLVEAVRNVSTIGHNLSLLQRSTGLAARQIQLWEEIASRVGSSAQAMDQGLKGFNSEMERLARAPRLEIMKSFQELNVMPVGGVVDRWLELFNTIKGLPRSEQLDQIIKFAGTIKDFGQREVFLNVFKLPPELAQLPGQLDKIVGAIEKYKRVWTDKDVETTDKTWTAFANLKLSLSGLGDEIGIKLAPGFERIATSLADFVKARQEGAGELFTTMAAAVQGPDWAGFATNLRSIAGAADAVAQSLGGWTPILKGLVDIQFRPLLKAAEGLRLLIEAFEKLRGLPSALPSTPSPPDMHKGALFDREKLFPGGYLFPSIQSERIMRPGAEISPEREMPPAGTGPGPGKDTRPLWRRLFDMTDRGGGITPAAYRVEGGGPNPLLGGGGLTPSTSEAGRMISLAVERGTFDGLQDYARSMQPGGGGGGGGAGGGGMAALKAAYSPGGGGGYGGAGAGTGEPAAGGGGAGTGTTSTRPMGSLPGLGRAPGGAAPGAAPGAPGAAPGAPQYPTSLDQLGGGAGAPGKGDPRGMLAAVRQAAIKHGINPDLMERVARSEGLADKYGTGDHGTSFGAMQLHRGGRGSVGTEFERETGLNLADPKNEKAATEFAAGWVAKHGWAAWSGARRQGITGRMGVGIDTSKWKGELGGGKAPHFDVAGIRKSLEGTAAAPRGDASGPPDMLAPNGQPPKAFILHHTGGRGTPESVVNDWRQRRPGVGTQLIMDREGVIHDVKKEFGYGGHGHFLHGKFGLANANTAGMEIISKNDADMTARQKANTRAYLQGHYTSSQILGHSEVSPRDRTNEGADLAAAVRAEREHPSSVATGAGLHGAALRSHFGHRQRADAPDLRPLVQQSMGMTHKVEGNASLSVDFKNMPKGVEAKGGKMAGMFKELKINRGRAAVPASQEG
jgi:hypothetical protein